MFLQAFDFGAQCFFFVFDGLAGFEEFAACFIVPLVGIFHEFRRLLFLLAGDFELLLGFRGLSQGLLERGFGVLEGLQLLRVVLVALVLADVPGEIRFEACHYVEPQQAVDGRPDQFAGLLLVGKPKDVFAVEEKEAGERGGEVAFDVFVPVRGERWIDFHRVLIRKHVHAELLLDVVVDLGPASGHLETLHLAGHLAVVCERDAGALAGLGRPAHQRCEVLVIAFASSVGALGVTTMQAEQDGVAQRRLASAVEAADQDHRLLRAGGREVDRHLPGIDAEVAEPELFDDHA